MTGFGQGGEVLFCGLALPGRPSGTPVARMPHSSQSTATEARVEAHCLDALSLTA
jgi:hypothetical protein